MDAIEYYEGSQKKTKVTVKGILQESFMERTLRISNHYSFLVDDKVYVDAVHNKHIYDVPVNSGWVWLGDPWHPYTNPDFQIRRLYYGPRTEAQKYGLINWKK